MTKLILTDGENTFETWLPVDLLKNLHNVLPRPIARDDYEVPAKDYFPQDWYLKLQEEIFEVMDNVQIFNQFCVEYGENDKSSINAKNMTAEKIADIITVCISWLESLGYDEEKRSELFASVNEKNEKRGYFRNA